MSETPDKGTDTSPLLSAFHGNPRLGSLLRKVKQWGGCAPVNPGKENDATVTYAVENGILTLGKERVGPLGIYSGAMCITLTDAGWELVGREEHDENKDATAPVQSIVRMSTATVKRFDDAQAVVLGQPTESGRQALIATVTGEAMMQNAAAIAAIPRLIGALKELLDISASEDTNCWRIDNAEAAARRVLDEIKAYE